MENHGVTRRGFITLSGVGALVAMSYSSPAEARFSGDVSRAAVLAQSEYVVSSCFTANWRERVDVRFPASVPIPAAERGGRLHVEWDSRLFEVDNVFALSTSGELGVAAATFTPSSFEAGIRADTRALIPVVRARALYPNDSLADPRGSRLRFDRPGAAWVPFGMQRAAARPWGAELRATWLQAEQGAAVDLIVIRSVGPYPIPQGVTLTVGQPQTIRGRWAEDSIVRRASGAQRGELFRFEKPLAAGDEQTISFSPTGDLSAVINGAGTSGIVALAASPREWRSARATAAYDVASVTSSGTQLAIEAGRVS